MTANHGADANHAGDDRSVPLLAFVVGGTSYPLWHLLSPEAATDPWWPWLAISACFFAVPTVSLFRKISRSRLLSLIPACASLVTLHFFLLAAANEMHPFYAVGSTMAGLMAALFFRSKRAMAAYAAFVAVLAAALYLIEPSELKLAYWGAMLPALLFVYHHIASGIAHQQQLEDKVLERTQQLSEANQHLRDEIEKKSRLEEALRFSQKMEALGRMASGVAHEFNNLLTTIGVYADVVLGALPEASELRADVDQIRKTTNQAAALTGQLMIVSRRADARTSVFELNQLLSERKLLLRHLLGEDTQIVYALSPRACWIRADPDRLEQALINLALNARDAMPKGGAFKIETAPVEGDSSAAPGEPGKGQHVMLAVTDTGVGMDPGTRARVFDPFFSTKPASRGSGLGLSVVYSMVDEVGGHIHVQSQPGEGSRFALYFPKADAEATDDVLRVATPRATEGEVEAIEGARILLVEDEADLLQALTRVLSDDGYRVVEACDGADAAKIIDTPDERFDLVITDAVMPEMSGLELAAHVRAQHPSTQLLLISGQLNHPTLQGVTLPPEVKLLVKPFQIEDLRNAVREVLEPSSP